MSSINDKKLSSVPVHAAAKLADSPAKQLVSELLERLRGSALAWWSPEDLRATFPSRERFKWIEEETALRGHLTHLLTGLHAGAALAQRAQLQSELVDAALDAGDVGVATFEAAFEPAVLAAHGPEVRFWRFFRKQLPWEAAGKAEQRVVTFVLEQLLAEVKAGPYQRKPILTPLDVRRAIDAKVWARHVPEELRAKVDAARYEAEAKGRPFGASDELALIPPAVLCQHVPVAELRGVLDRAEDALGIARERAADAGARKDRPRLSQLAGVAQPVTSQAADELAFDFEDAGEVTGLN